KISLLKGKTAWDAVKSALGETNLTYKDYGGDLGIYITAINGIEPTGNQYWQFNINGNSSEVGVSSYIVQDNDKIEFKIATW
ncbi:DUF4430 domain-containing protein, partial [Candidatus Curtissbacteria bacterium]|nr:DUF4430 domain-containing protein [Candidatus Curtissbacteria bacterium]